MTQVHVGLPLIPLVKGKYDGKPEKYFIKLKLRRYPTSIMSNLNKFMMSLFDNGETEEFLLFMHNFNINITVSGALDIGAKIKYLCGLVCGEALRHFVLFTDDMESTDLLTVEYIIKGLSLYFPPVTSDKG